MGWGWLSLLMTAQWVGAQTSSGPYSGLTLSPRHRWLNTLGLLASQGIDVVVRHSFLDHGHNHLVDQNFNPLPVGLPGANRRDAPFSQPGFRGDLVFLFPAPRMMCCLYP